MSRSGLRPKAKRLGWKIIPMYTSSQLPCRPTQVSDSLRVAGLVRPAADIPKVFDVEYRLGNAAEFTSGFAAAIIHLVNDKAKSWGGFGFSRDLKQQHPSAFRDFRDWTMTSPKEHQLGNLHLAELPENRCVVSVVAQAGYGSSTRPRIRYGALDLGLERASHRLKDLGVVTVQMPRIGSGQAGGDWSIVAGNHSRKSGLLRGSLYAFLIFRELCNPVMAIRLVVVSGGLASGKSALANRLNRAFGCDVLRTSELITAPYSSGRLRSVVNARGG